MKAMRLRKPASLENVSAGHCEAPPPGPGEIRVCICACSINDRHTIVVSGDLPARDDCVLLSDAAGEVTDVGPGIGGFWVGDRVISCFHPGEVDGHVERAEFNRAPGGGRPLRLRGGHLHHLRFLPPPGV